MLGPQPCSCYSYSTRQTSQLSFWRCKDSVFDIIRSLWSRKVPLQNDTARPDLKLSLYIYTVLQPPAHMAVYKKWRAHIKSSRGWAKTTTMWTAHHLLLHLRDKLPIDSRRVQTGVSWSIKCFKGIQSRLTVTGGSWLDQVLQLHIHNFLENTTVGDDLIDNRVQPTTTTTQHFNLQWDYR